MNTRWKVLLTATVYCLILLPLITQPYHLCLSSHSHICHFSLQCMYLCLIYMLQTKVFTIPYLLAFTAIGLPCLSTSVMSVLYFIGKTKYFCFPLADVDTAEMLYCSTLYYVPKSVLLIRSTIVVHVTYCYHVIAVHVFTRPKYVVIAWAITKHEILKKLL